MKKITIYLATLFLTSTFSLHAQQKVIDSLENQLLNPTNGKNRTENLIQLGHYYSMINPEKGLVRLDEAIELATMNKDSFKLGAAFGNKGKNHISLGNDSLAFSLYDKAESIFRAIDSTKALSKLMFNKGLLYSERSNYQSAAENVQNALEIFTADRDTLLMGYSLGTLGYYRIFLGDYTASMEAFLKGMSLLEQIKQEESILYASAQGNMGILYQKIGKLNTALELHQKALGIFKKNDNQYLMASQYAEIGNIYDQQGKFKKALVNYQASYSINKKNHNKGRMAAAFSNIGLTYSHLKQYNKAITYLDSAMTINKALKDYGKLSINHHNKGEAYYHKNEISKARKSFNSSLIYAKKLGNKRMVYEAKLGVSLMASIKGDYKTAFNVLDEAVIIRDTLLSDEKRDELANLKAKYEYEKEKAILEAGFENKKSLDKAKIKQQVLIRNFSIGAIILIALSLFSFLKLKHKKDKLKEVYNTETRISQKVHDELANDVYNVMNRIQNNSKIQQKEVINQLEDIYKRTRDISYQNSTINLENNYYVLELKDMINAYQNKSTKITTVGLNTAIFENVANHKKIITERVLKELMTNMKKHSKASNVAISFKKDKRNINIRYADDGIGFKKSNLTKQNGLQNAENRIKNINGSFNFGSNTEKGVVINISFPV